MQPALIARPPRNSEPRPDERGFTLALVAAAMVAMIGMAALAIDVGTLYQAKAEAQRAADAGALAAARIISISGITGDPALGATDGSWGDICGGSGSPATLAAMSVAKAPQNLVGGLAAKTVTVNYAGSNGASTTDCKSAGTAFPVNPVVTVTVTSAKLPIFFARVFSLLPNGSYSGATVSATAAAEAFNPAGSASLPSGMIPVQPRCVKPWIIPNRDPGNPIAPNNFVSPVDGSISRAGISPAGVIGESFSLNADCNSPGVPGTCALSRNPPGYSGGILHYVPALVSGNPGAVPSCSASTGFGAAVAGCDQTTAYACGTPNGAAYNLSENPVNPSGATGDTATAVACLIQSSPSYNGSDTLAPRVYPFQIGAGLGNPLVVKGLVNNNDLITTSDSIVTIPIYDSTPGVPLTSQVTILGFLQVFIMGPPNLAGDINVTVLNVSGCSNNATNPAASGTSPVPVRLITPP